MNVDKDNSMKNQVTDADERKKQRSEGKTRFDLEQEIMTCWNVTQDLEALFNEVMNREMSRDDMANIVLGMKVLYDIKFNTLFETFEHCCHTRNI